MAPLTVEKVTDSHGDCVDRFAALVHDE